MPPAVPKRFSSVCNVARAPDATSQGEREVITVPHPSPAEVSAPPLAVRVREVDPTTAIVAADGDLDLATAPALKWAVVDAFHNRYDRVVVDLSEASFIDSTTIGVLLGITTRLQSGQRLVVGGASTVVREVFRYAGVERALPIYPDVEAGLAHLDEPSGGQARR